MCVPRLWSTYIEWGDLGHGPLCIASLDGKMQKALEGTDAADLTYGWLPNGSLLYVGVEGDQPCIIIVRPDGTSGVFARSSDFVVR